MKSALLLLSALFISLHSDAQKGAIASFWKLSCPEKWWVISHPFVSKKAFEITGEARMISDSVMLSEVLDNDPLGGQVDAFRHAYWMARLAQSMKWKKALRLGRAHEKANEISFRKKRADEEGVLPDSVSSAMDLFNNQFGVAVGCNFKFLGSKEIGQTIIDSIKSGKLKVILKDKNGNELNCDGSLIDKSQFSGIWSIPKCLVNSNYLFK